MGARSSSGPSGSAARGGHGGAAAGSGAVLKGVPFSKRKSCFKCAIAIADKGRLIGAAEGICRGKIGFESKGDNGFGYDPLFIPEGFKKSFAEMSPARKNQISHRSRALARAKKIIVKYLSPYL
jgi:XTP/dITP diphosphohydrolase